ncbi:MAG: DUF1329 domain-containing protein [Desulfobacterales bacterium]
MGRKRMRLLVAAAVALIFCVTGISFADEPKPGDVIDSSNVDQYKDYMPTILYGFIKDGWGFVKPAVIHVRDRTDVDVPSTFIEATKKNIGKVTLNEDGSISGLVAGLPFPDPKEPNLAMKVMWNHYYRWRSDGYTYNDGYWYTSQRKNGPISSTLTQIDMFFYSHRTAVDPKPVYPNNNDLFSALWLNTRTGVNKDMVTLAWRYNDTTKPDDMWTYIPTLRRTLRMMSSERANPVRGTPFTWDDFYGFDGRPRDWEPVVIGEPKILALMNQQTRCTKGTEHERGYKHPVVSGPSDPYELREMYCIDVTPKSERHPEQKKTLWIEKDIYHCMYAHVFDKQGNLWKGQMTAVINYATAQDQPAWTQCSDAMTDLKNFYWSNNLLDTVTADGPMNMDHFNPAALGTTF